LLRAVNVGGKNLLPMADLAKICSRAGCASVRTYIQSGNVVFSADEQSAQQMSAIVEKAIEKQFGFRSPVIVRSAKEMKRIVASNPFPDTKQVYVGFLRDKPAARSIAALDPNRSPGDAFEVIGREIFMNLAIGAGKTKLTTAYFDSKLDTVSTFRNWRTVLKLCEMLDES
jgi:uncharacterized protein (DUF1697 family)